MTEPVGEITVLLNQWREGSAEAENELFLRLNNELRRLAQYLLKGERKGFPMQATELVDQIYMRLVAAKDRDWRNRHHFFAIAARAMRHHLIDLARNREDGEEVAIEKLEQILPAESAKLNLVMTVDRLLNDLAKREPDWCTVVELKYFAGLTDDQVAEVMGVKLRTMQRMWRDARQWLYERAEARHAANNTQ